MTNREQYITDLAERDEEYRTSIKEFTEWIIDHNMADRFISDLKSIGVHNNVYDIAVDYSIPVMMVKYFQKEIA